MLALDATLITLQDTVPVEYVRRVLENVRECELSVGDARVSIAVNDTRPCPSYSIRAVMDLDTGEGMQWQDFEGIRHRPLTEKQSRMLVWSTNEITYAELRKLIGDMRNFTA
jgi:hypothetical protein